MNSEFSSVPYPVDTACFFMPGILTEDPKVVKGRVDAMAAVKSQAA